MRIAADMLFLKYGLGGEVFGLEQNPFQLPRLQVEHLSEQGKLITVHQACCMQHRTDEGVYCYECPHLTEEYRVVRRAIHRREKL